MYAIKSEEFSAIMSSNNFYTLFSFSSPPGILIMCIMFVCLVVTQGFLKLLPFLNCFFFLLLEQDKFTLTNVAQLLGCIPQSERLPVPLLVRAHAWGCRFSAWPGHVPEVADLCFSHTLMFLFLCFFLPSPLSKKINK